MQQHGDVVSRFADQFGNYSPVIIHMVRNETTERKENQTKMLKYIHDILNIMNQPFLFRYTSHTRTVAGWDSRKLELHSHTQTVAG